MRFRVVEVKDQNIWSPTAIVYERDGLVTCFAWPSRAPFANFPELNGVEDFTIDRLPGLKATSSRISEPLAIRDSANVDEMLEKFQAANARRDRGRVA